MVGSMVQGSEPLTIFGIETTPQLQQSENSLGVSPLGSQVHGSEVVMTLGLQLTLLDFVLDDQ